MKKTVSAIVEEIKNYEERMHNIDQMILLFLNEKKPVDNLIQEYNKLEKLHTKLSNRKLIKELNFYKNAIKSVNNSILLALKSGYHYSDGIESLIEEKNKHEKECDKILKKLV